MNELPAAATGGGALWLKVWKIKMGKYFIFNNRVDGMDGKTITYNKTSVGLYVRKKKRQLLVFRAIIELHFLLFELTQRLP